MHLLARDGVKSEVNATCIDCRYQVLMLSLTEMTKDIDGFYENDCTNFLTAGEKTSGTVCSHIH